MAAAGRVVWKDHSLRRGLLLAAALLIGVGLVSVGVSGALSLGEKLVTSDRFVAGDSPGQTYSSSLCAEFREYAPDARSCLDAAATHHAGEVIQYRTAAGVLGALVLAAWAVLRRRSPGASTPPILVPAIGAAVFLLAAAALGVQALDSLLLDAAQGGAGQWLSAAFVASVAGLWFAGRLVVVTAKSRNPRSR